MNSSTETRRFAPLGLGAATDLNEQRQAARALGYAEGWASGQRGAQAEIEAVRTTLEREHAHTLATARHEFEQALAALQSATRQLVTSTTPLLDEVADVVLAGSITLASAVLGAELATMDDTATPALRRVLAPLPTDARVTVRLHPTDHARLLAALEDPTSFERHEVRLLSDPTLSPGDALADQAGSVVDGRLQAALARALDVIRQGVESE